MEKPLIKELELIKETLEKHQRALISLMDLKPRESEILKSVIDNSSMLTDHIISLENRLRRIELLLKDISEKYDKKNKGNEKEN